MATIRDAGISGDFVHEPLSNPQAEIRLIQVDLSGDKDRKIRCTISIHPLSDPPPYVAISYTWGDNSMMREIWVDEKRLNIGHNSWLALWQARLHRVQEPLQVWIDVLSIDQANDFEKSIQVGLMGSIYKAAKCVVASVGAQEDDSEHLAEQVNAHAIYLKSLRELYDHKEDPPVKRIYCRFCKQLLQTEAAQCFGCSDAGDRESSWFCHDCARDHEQTGHSTYTSSLFSGFMKYCNNCDRELPFRWYKPKRSGAKFCRACQQFYRSERVEFDNDAANWILTDIWGPVDKSPGRFTSRWSSETWITCSRLKEMSDEAQKRIANAFSAFSFRKYFARLWIVQENRFADHVLVVCGESVFTLDAFSILAWDIRRYPQYFGKVRGQTVAESKHMKALLNMNVARGASLWRLVAFHCDYHCADTRDRVFGLLSLSSNHAIWADYTKSTLQVLLQLLEQEACGADNETTQDARAMSDVLSVIGAFHLGPLAAESADMFRKRFLAHAAPRSSSHELVFDRRDQRKIVLHSELCCKVWEDDAGNLLTSLRENDLRYIERYAKNDAVKLRNSLGKVVALADKKVKSGDVLLFFKDTRSSTLNRRPLDGLSPPTAGIIVRPLESGTHIVVGQVVANLHGIRVRRKGWSPGETGIDQHGFEIGDNFWWIMMSPEDLFVFAAQDMSSKVSSSGEGVGSVIKWMYHPEETAKRLTTSVTADLASSYAIRQQVRGESSPPVNPAIVLRSDSIDFP